MNHRLAAIFPAFLLVTASCAAPVADLSVANDNPDVAVGGVDPDTDRSQPDDPPTDRLGWEAGYQHDESIMVDQSDGLNDSEIEAFVARAMARVEVVCKLEFEESVSIEVVPHAEYRNESDASADPIHSNWNDRAQEALLLVGEDRTIGEVLDKLYGGVALGYYSPSEDRIVVASDDSQPTIDRRALAYRLVYTTQNQQFGLDHSPPTQDTQPAYSGLVEGDTRYIDSLYEARCKADQDCIPQPSSNGADGGSVNYPVFITIYTPHSEGPTFVSDLCNRSGRVTVDVAHADHPTSTEQVLHPTRYLDRRSVEVTVEGRSSAAWTHYNTDPTAGAVGEASVFTALWKHHAVGRTSLQ